MSGSFNEHLNEMRKDLTQMNAQILQQRNEIEKNKTELAQFQMQAQNVTDPIAQASLQMELSKTMEIAKRLEGVARTYVTLVTDANVQMQLVADLDAANKAMQGPQNLMGLPMMGRNPMMPSPMAMATAAASSPRMPKPNGMPNGVMPPNGMHAMAQMAAAQQQAIAFAQMQAAAAMFPMQGMMAIPGMQGMQLPPGMNGIPGMMPPNMTAAAMAQLNNAQMQAISVSTPSRNHSTSGAASRTRTPMTASATNSPRPAEPAKEVEEATTTAAPDVSPTAAGLAATTNEDNTVAVA